LEVGKSGYIWVAAPTGNNIGGLLVYDINETIDDLTDDDSYFYSIGTGTGNLPSQDVKCVVEDLDEEIWVGTADGLAIIYDQDAAFGGNNSDAQQILIEQDGNVQILLENEVITDIEVDGANRKWIATEGSGVFLLSEDGQDEILRLTKENSPLLSNIVYDVAIDNYSGDVYFATSDGVISLRYTATGSIDPYLDVFAFPNPVRSDYEGIIAVKGLSRDSDFKVTDLTGNLIYHGTSLGGQAIWDLKDFNGIRVSTGVYLIYCNSESGAKDAVAKLLVVN
jgi:ligand-binding sensor domain-containing protein